MGERAEILKVESALLESNAMNIRCSLFSVLAFSLIVPLASAQKTHKSMTGTAAKGSASTGMQVAPDLAERLSRWREVRMPFDAKGLSAREVKLVNKLVDASRYLEEIFWRQSDPEALTLYQSLGASANARDRLLRKYVWINASRYDLLDENRPFVGTAPLARGRGFYPQGLTRQQIEQYVQQHPAEKRRDLQLHHGGALAPGPARRPALPHCLPVIS